MGEEFGVGRITGKGLYLKQDTMQIFYTSKEGKDPV